MLQLGIKSRPKREPRTNADAYTQKRKKTLSGTNGRDSVCTAQVDDGVATRVRHGTWRVRKDNLLGEDIDHASTQSLMADTTNSLLGDRHMSCPSSAAANTLAQCKLGLYLHIACLAQICHNSGFIENGIGCAHPALEIELEFLDWQWRWYQIQRCICR